MDGGPCSEFSTSPPVRKPASPDRCISERIDYRGLLWSRRGGPVCPEEYRILKEMIVLKHFLHAPGRTEKTTCILRDDPTFAAATTVKETSKHSARCDPSQHASTPRLGAHRRSSRSPGKYAPRRPCTTVYRDYPRDVLRSKDRCHTCSIASNSVGVRGLSPCRSSRRAAEGFRIPRCGHAVSIKGRGAKRRGASPPVFLPSTPQILCTLFRSAWLLPRLSLPALVFVSIRLLFFVRLPCRPTVLLIPAFTPHQKPAMDSSQFRAAAHAAIEESIVLPVSPATAQLRLRLTLSPQSSTITTLSRPAVSSPLSPPATSPRCYPLVRPPNPNHGAPSSRTSSASSCLA